MNGFTVALLGPPRTQEPLLVTIVRRDESAPHAYHSCHLFAYHGVEELDVALENALREYLSEYGDDIAQGLEYGRTNDEIDWFEMMAERENYGDIFAKHGLTEVRIPMGMVSLVFDNNEPIASYAEVI